MRKLTVGNLVFLNVSKQIVSLIYLEYRYLVSVKFIGNIPERSIQTFCKEHNIKQDSHLLASKHTKHNLGILNVNSVNCIIIVIYVWSGYMCMPFMYVESL